MERRDEQCDHVPEQPDEHPGDAGGVDVPESGVRQPDGAVAAGRPARGERRINLYQFNGNNPASYSDPFGLCPPLLGTKAPCALFIAAMGEAKANHAQAEAAALTHVLINRALDEGTTYAKGPGRSRTGNLEADVVAQASDMHQVQGNNPHDQNTQDDQMRNLLALKSGFTDAGAAKKATGGDRRRRRGLTQRSADVKDDRPKARLSGGITRSADV